MSRTNAMRRYILIFFALGPVIGGLCMLLLVAASEDYPQALPELFSLGAIPALIGGRGRGLVFKKKSQEGAAVRAELLSSVFGSEQVARLVQSVARREAATDDVLDALVALWSAERVAAGEAVSLPAPAAADATGLAAAIWD